MNVCTKIVSFCTNDTVMESYVSKLLEMLLSAILKILYYYLFNLNALLTSTNTDRFIIYLRYRVFLKTSYELAKNSGKINEKDTLLKSLN